MGSEAAQPASQDRPPARELESYRAPIEALLNTIIARGGFQLSFTMRRLTSPEADLEAPELVVDFSGPDSDLLVEANGELLNALEYIVLKAVRLEEELFTKITFDCHQFRRLRREELKLMAQVAADRALESGAPFPLERLTARERRIVHLALRERSDVRTESQGYGAERRLVIIPAALGRNSAGPDRR